MLNHELCDRHFTSSAIHIIDQLFARAADRSMRSLSLTEHTVTMLLLWSMLRWERKVGLATLEHLGVVTDLLARELDGTLQAACDEASQLGSDPSRHVPLRSGQPAEVIDLRTPLQPLLSQAEHEALAMGHSWVGSEHLLLAIIRRACPLLRKLLEKHSVTYEATKHAIQEILRA